MARIKRGASALAPEVDLLESSHLAGQDNSAVKAFLSAWLAGHIREILGPLLDLDKGDEVPAPVRGICYQLHQAMGITPRENVEDLIALLDPPMRQVLRAKQVRLGPILVFMPALNKPAAVRLRGLLWSIWNDKPLPAGVPADGVVSVKVDAATADRRFYQAIGYPVFGPRAIRIDMLDRVISAVYDNAKDGKFRAEHKMAEWLGSSIDDLYAVLEAMGHRKIEEPLNPVAAEPAPAAAPAPQEEQASFSFMPEEGKSQEVSTAAEVKADLKPGAKPELAVFRLKKGKAFEKPRFKKPVREEKPRHKDKSRKVPHKKSEEPRVISAASKIVADSPFAILEQLKVKKDASGS